MKALLIAAAFAGLAGVAVAEAPATTQAPDYVVIEPNARVSFSRQALEGFQVGHDHSLLIEATGNRWYRATLTPPCDRQLGFHEVIGVDDRPLNTFDQFSTVVVGHDRCMIERLDRIEPPTHHRNPS